MTTRTGSPAHEAPPAPPASSLLVREILLPSPMEPVFRYFADARNLEELTPPWLRFRIVTPPPILMQVGARIEYRLRIRGLPVRWRTRIDEWEPPHRFVDLQERGPYRWWHHEHLFEDRGHETLVRDVVHYRAPLAFVTESLFVRQDVERIFDYRHQQLERRFGPAAQSVAS